MFGEIYMYYKGYKKVAHKTNINRFLLYNSFLGNEKYICFK